MKKRLVEADAVTADYYCDTCEKRENDVPIQESIYTGPPMCALCDVEMSLDKVHLKE